MAINSIDSPIEQQHTGKGNPNAILTFDIPLNNRQQALLERLPYYDSRIVVPKEMVNMTDLSALTAKTGDEFALFTKGCERLIVRGNASRVKATPHKDCVRIAKSDFSLDCTKTTQEYFVYFKELLCKITENMQARRAQSRKAVFVRCCLNITIEEAQQLAKNGYRWSGHTHPGTSDNCMTSSPGDHAILDCFKQNMSVIYNSKGLFRTFEKEV